MTGWEKEWPKDHGGTSIDKWPNPTKMNNGSTITWTEPVIYGGGRNQGKTLKSQGSNLVDAEAYLYFQCEGCDTILDPHTRSFARLQQARVDKGWQCVWNTNGLGYNVYCEKCGEK